MISAVQGYGFTSQNNFASKVNANNNIAFTGKGKLLNKNAEMLIEKANVYFNRLTELLTEKNTNMMNVENKASFGKFEDYSMLALRKSKDLIVKVKKLHSEPNQLQLQYMDKHKRLNNTLTVDVSEKSFGKILGYRTADKTNLRGLFDFKNEALINARQVEDLNNEISTYLPELVGKI